VTSGDRNPEELQVRPSLFRAPAWSPDGEEVLLAIMDDEGCLAVACYALAITNLETQETRKLAAFEKSIAFSWSPDGKRVAYVPSERVEGVLGPLIVMDPNKPEEQIATKEEVVVAYFWSPNSRQIAYFVPHVVPASEGSAQTDIIMELLVLDVRNGKSWEVFSYRPTPQFFQLIPHFDQYGHSATIWSPDSDNLVITALYGENKAGIFMLAASGRLEPRYLADGMIAFWSWK